MYYNNIQKQLTIDSNYAIFINSNGILYQLGENDKGQLGLGDNSITESNLIQINSSYFNFEKIVEIDSYNKTAMALTESGNVYIWGNNNNNYPTIINPELFNHEKIIDIQIGSGMKQAITENGDIYTWGTKFIGRTGDNNIPLPIERSYFNDQGVKYVQAGKNNQQVIQDNGILYVWGEDRYFYKQNVRNYNMEERRIELYQTDINKPLRTRKAPEFIKIVDDILYIYDQGKILKYLESYYTNFDYWAYNYETFPETKFGTETNGMDYDPNYYGTIVDFVYSKPNNYQEDVIITESNSNFGQIIISKFGKLFVRGENILSYIPTNNLEEEFNNIKNIKLNTGIIKLIIDQNNIKGLKTLYYNGQPINPPFTKIIEYGDRTNLRVEMKNGYEFNGWTIENL